VIATVVIQLDSVCLTVVLSYKGFVFVFYPNDVNINFKASQNFIQIFFGYIGHRFINKFAGTYLNIAFNNTLDWFVLFFTITLDNFLSPDPYFYGLLILGVMFLARYAYFSLSEFKLQPSTKVFLSPRGLISILLFFQLQDSNIPGLDNQPINEKVLLIVIIFSMLIMIVGTLRKTPPKQEEEAEETEETVAFSITNPDTTLESNTESLNETDVPTPEE